MVYLPFTAGRSLLHWEWWSKGWSTHVRRKRERQWQKARMSFEKIGKWVAALSALVWLAWLLLGMAKLQQWNQRKDHGLVIISGYSFVFFALYPKSILLTFVTSSSLYFDTVGRRCIEKVHIHREHPLCGGNSDKIRVYRWPMKITPHMYFLRLPPTFLISTQGWMKKKTKQMNTS